jgi:hypothetical protein
MIVGAIGLVVSLMFHMQANRGVLARERGVERDPYV